MRIANIQVFDNIISGAGPWYSGTAFNQLIGRSSWYAVQTYATSVGGTSPTLSIQSEVSPDSVTWVATGHTEITLQPINTTPVQVGQFLPGIDAGLGLAAFVRFKITMAGTNPLCRLKLYVTCRANAIDAASAR